MIEIDLNGRRALITGATQDSEPRPRGRSLKPARTSRSRIETNRGTRKASRPRQEPSAAKSPSFGSPTSRAKAMWRDSSSGWTMNSTVSTFS